MGREPMIPPQGHERSLEKGIESREAVSGFERRSSNFRTTVHIHSSSTLLRSPCADRCSGWMLEKAASRGRVRSELATESRSSSVPRVVKVCALSLASSSASLSEPYPRLDPKRAPPGHTDSAPYCQEFKNLRRAHPRLGPR